MRDDDQDGQAREDEAGIGRRIVRAIRQSLSGAGKDTNLPLEDEEGNPREATPAEKQEITQRKHTQTMDRLKNWGQKITSSPGIQAEIAKAKKRQGKSDLDATREAIGGK